MKNKILKRIILQLKEYELDDSFSNEQNFKNWITKLNQKQINNFLSLNISKEEIKFPKEMLINRDLLNCEDYNKRIKALTNIKNGNGWYHLFDALLNPNFINSKNFYKDIDMISKAETAQYALWVIGENDFIKSPYHDEDLRLIVESRDTNKEKKLDSVVWEALATVAGNIYSIKSHYHKQDMKLIANCGSDYLQFLHSYPESSINCLATNQISLKDKYHLENMQLLIKYPKFGDMLYQLMTNEIIISGNYYREEIMALATAKDISTAKSLYYYILNPETKYHYDNSLHFSYESLFKIGDRETLELSYFDAWEVEDQPIINGWSDQYFSKFIKEENRIKQIEYNKIKKLPQYDYLNNLNFISKASNLYNFFYTSLLMNENFIFSKNKNLDLETLKSIKINTVANKNLFIELYKLFKEAEFQENIHHKSDLKAICETKKDQNRNLMIKIATNKTSIKSKNHLFDMQYTSQINFENIKDERILNKIIEYLCCPKLINDKNHIYVLEQLKLLECVDDLIIPTQNCLIKLEKELNNSKSELTTEKSKVLSKIKKIFRS